MQQVVSEISFLPNKPHAGEEDHEQWKMYARFWNQIMSLKSKSQELKEEFAELQEFQSQIQKSCGISHNILWGPKDYPSFVTVLWPDPAFAIFEPDCKGRSHTFPNTEIDDECLVVYEVPTWGHFIIGRKLWAKNSSFFPQVSLRSDTFVVKFDPDFTLSWALSEISNLNDWKSQINELNAKEREWLV